MLTMAEQQQAHRIRPESTEQMNDVSVERRGQWMGFIIYFGAAAGALASVYLQAHPTVSCAFVGIPAIGIIKAFLAGRRNDP